MITDRITEQITIFTCALNNWYKIKQYNGRN